MMIILRDSLHSTNSENKDNDISVSLFELVRRKITASEIRVHFQALSLFYSML